MNYDAMVTAIADAGRRAMGPVGEPDAGNRRVRFVDAVRDVRRIRAKAMASGLYSKHPDARRKAYEIRCRAERRLAQLIIEGKAASLLTTLPTKGEKIGTQTDKLTLKDLGISRRESQDWQKFARMSDVEFEAWLAATKPITPRLSRRGTRHHAHGDEAGQLTSTATRSIANIKIGTRHRKDLGDIEALARSIADVGLLHPIVVRADGTLIAGERRLAAYRLLGRTEIPVTIVDLDDIVRGELAENAERKDFLPSEIDAIRRALEPVEKAAAKERQGSRNDLRENFPEVGEQRVRDKIGALAGVSGRTVEKIAAVVAAAEADPEKFGHLVEEMDKTGKVDRAHKQLHGQKGEGQRRTPHKPKPAASNDAPNDVAQASRDLAPEQKAEAAPPVASTDPAPPPDPHPLQRRVDPGGLCGTIMVLARIKDVDFGPVAAAMPIEQLQEARDESDEAALTIGKWRGALDVALESAAVREKEPPPAGRGVREC
jgi:ParB/RepB/Spo0J family partition protein